MHKVLCEEPRGGQYWARRFPRPQISYEDSPKYEGIKRPHTRRKWFGEHLGPLKRWLRSNVGRPWNDVYSEGSPIFKPDNVVRAHIRFHLLQMVERNTFMRDGEVWCRRYGWGGFENRVSMFGGSTCHPVFYVHPETALLLEAKSTWRQERKAQRQAEKLNADHRWLTVDTMLKRIDGIWYLCRFETMAANVPYGYDQLARRIIHCSESRRQDGLAATCVHKRQLARHELKRFGLVNQTVMEARSSGHLDVLKTALSTHDGHVRNHFYTIRFKIPLAEQLRR